MADITVQEIIATFKGVKRELLTFSHQSDDFIELMQKKQHWTFEEYQQLSYEYSLENMIVSVMDFKQIKRVVKQYNFQLTWEDHFNVIENIKDIRKQKKYVNYYIWYHGSTMTEDIYKKFLNKPYFKLLDLKGKIHFLQNKLKTNNTNTWLLNYFTYEEIQQSLIKSNLNIILSDNNNLEEIQQVKNFYNEHEVFMVEKVKNKLFYEALRTGSFPLIEFFYREKGIQKLNKLKVLWYICSEICDPNTIEIFNFLNTLGIKLTPSIVKKFEKKDNWTHLEYRSTLLNHLKDVEREKNYYKLSSKIKNKPVKFIKNKI